MEQSCPKNVLYYNYKKKLKDLKIEEKKNKG